jgi:hypothetical protein
MHYNIIADRNAQARCVVVCWPCLVRCSSCFCGCAVTDICIFVQSSNGAAFERSNLLFRYLVALLFAVIDSELYEWPATGLYLYSDSCHSAVRTLTRSPPGVTQ